MGPTVAIWPTPQSPVPSPEDLIRIANLLDPEAADANDFHVASTIAIGGAVRADEPRPFGLALGAVGSDDPDLARAAHLFGFTPTVAVHALAYANQQVDHRVLGELELFLARELRGLVDFGGSLGSLIPPQGKLVAIPYAGSSGDEAFHIGDAAFLEWWLQQPGFHMIK